MSRDVLQGGINVDGHILPKGIEMAIHIMLFIAARTIFQTTSATSLVTG